MPALTLYLNAGQAGTSGHSKMVDGVAQASNTSGNGWTVAKTAPTVRARMQAGTKLAATAFTATDQPSGAPSGQDCFRTENTYTGSFAAGTWDVAVPLIAVANGGAQDGRIKFRIWRGTDASGNSGLTELTAGIQSAGLVTNLATGAEQSSSLTTASIAGFSVTAEYLFLQIAFEITGAGGNTSADVLIREGSGSRVITPVFTSSAPSFVPLDPMGMSGFFGA